MSPSYWLQVIALGGLVFSGPLQAENQSHGAHQASNAARGQQQISAGPEGVPAPVQADRHRLANALESANSKGRSQEEKREAGADLEAQQSMARSARQMFIVGIAETCLTMLGVILVGWTLYHTRRAATAAENAVTETRRIGQAQVRAYVSIKDVTIDFVKPGHVPIVTALFVNTGQSPAREVMAFPSVAYGWPAQHKSARYCETWRDHVGFEIPAGDESEQQFKMLDADLDNFVGDFANSDQQDRNYVGVLLSFNYLDVFGRRESYCARFGGYAKERPPSHPLFRESGWACILERMEMERAEEQPPDQNA